MGHPMLVRKVGAGLGAAFVALLVPLAATASAEVSGPCSGMIKGVDVSTRSSSKVSDAILVTKTEQVSVGATAAGTIDKYKIQMHFAGIAWTVGKGSADGNSWSKTVNVAPYARYGVGLYKVSGVSSGGANCTGAALVKVEGSALTTPAGMASIVLAGIGMAGVVSVCTKGWRPRYPPEPVQFISDDFVSGTMNRVRTPQDYVRTVEHICGNDPRSYIPRERVTALIHYVDIDVATRPIVETVCRWG